MKLFDRKINSEFLSNGPWYSLLALYMPMSALIAFIYLLETLFASSFPMILLITFSFISALTASLYCDFLKDSMSDHTTANVRGGIIIFAVSYIASSLFRLDTGWKERFLPSLFNFPVCACTLYMWTNVISLKQLFGACKRLETHTGMYHGDELKRVIYEDSSLLIYTDEMIAKARRNYFIKLVFLGILTIICSFLAAPPLALYLLLVVILVNGICIFGFFGIIREEHYYAGDGVCLSAPDRTKRILAIVVFSLLCIAAAILPSSDKSILPFSIITGFFKWLFSLFRPPEPNTTAFNNNENLLGMEPYESFPNFQEIGAPSPLWEQIRKYISVILRYGIIILAAAGFIRFMISPLLNRGDISGKLTFRQKLKKIITEWYKSMLNAFAAFIAYLKRDKTTSKLRKYDAEEIRRAAESIFGAYSPAKRHDIRRSVTLFARLIIWGGEVRGVTWKPSLAPGEYCGILAAAKTLQNDTDDSFTLQRRNEGIIRCGELFEQALYSAEILREEEREEFKNLVEEITAVSE